MSTSTALVATQGVATSSTIVPATSKKDSSKRDIVKEVWDLPKASQSKATHNCTEANPTRLANTPVLDEQWSTLDKNEKPVQSTAYWVEMYAAVTRWGVTYTFNEDTRLFELDCPQRLPSTPSEPY